jgi:Protein of unknown function (DUF1573)
MKVNSVTLTILGALWVATSAHASLKWESTEQVLHPTINDTTAVAHYQFENVGKTPVHIDSVKTSCGCTVASLKSNDIAPGEKGEIVATLNIGDRVGMQTKAITVTTNDPAQPRVSLVLKADVPTLLEVRPLFIFWNTTEPLNPKEINVIAPADSPVTGITATSSVPAISAKVEPSKTPKQWTVVVTPSGNVNAGVAGELVIHPAYPGKAQKIYHVTVRVMKRTTS